MKLKRKIQLLLITLVIFITIAITSYSTYSQQKNYINRELQIQEQIVALLQRSMSDLNYNYISSKLDELMHLKQTLSYTASLFETAANKKLSHYKGKITDKILVRDLHNIVDQLNGNAQLVIYHHNQLLTKPNRFFAEASNIQGLSFLETQKYIDIGTQHFSTLQYQDQYVLALGFKLDNFEDYFFGIYLDISDKVKLYSNNDANIITSSQKLLRGLTSAWAGRAVILDAINGKILFDSHKDRQQFADNADSYEDLYDDTYLTLDKLQNVDNEPLRIMDDKFYIFAIKFNAFNWYIVTSKSMEETVAQTNSIATMMLLIGSLCILIVIPIGMYFSSRITKPLKEITTIASDISSHDLSDQKMVENLSKRLTMDRADEVGNLAASFRFMLLSLKQNITKLIATTSVNNRIEGELNAAREIQLGMLTPKEQLPSDEHIDSYAFLEPAKEVGGDLYDCFYIDDRHLAICLGDVSDKGVPAALFMSTTLNLQKIAFAIDLDPQRAMNIINAKLAEHNPNLMFVTLFLAILDVQTGELIASNAGHCPPIIKRKSGQLEILDKICGPAVGVVEDYSYEQYQTKLADGDFMLIYSDGISEAQNTKRELFGENRIYEVIKAQSYHDPKELTLALKNAVYAFRGEALQSDDITVLSVYKKS